LGQRHFPALSLFRHCEHTVPGAGDTDCRRRTRRAFWFASVPRAPNHIHRPTPTLPKSKIATKATTPMMSPMRDELDEVLAVKSYPHELQKRLPGSTLAPHFGQVPTATWPGSVDGAAETGTGCPQSPQNLSLRSNSAPHFAHFMTIPPAHCLSSRKVPR